MLSKYGNFVSCDVETGGLLTATKKAIFDVALTEVALVAVNESLEITDSKSWLVKPYSDKAEYNKGAEMASGISKQMCEEKGEDIKIIHSEIRTFLKAQKSGNRLPVIFGHNFLNFDAHFMINLFEYCGDDLMKYVQDEPEDTLKWARMRWKESNNYKLGTCCENAGITLIDAHRAGSDTYATAQLWIHFMKNLRGENTKQLEPTKRFRANFEL
jgi:DNA polymerase III alpha subunit (gram-positive type)